MSSSHVVQGSAKRRTPDLVNFVPAVAYHICLALSAAFTQPGNHLLAEPCVSLSPCSVQNPFRNYGGHERRNGQQARFSKEMVLRGVFKRGRGLFSAKGGRNSRKLPQFFTSTIVRGRHPKCWESKGVVLDHFLAAYL